MLAMGGYTNAAGLSTLEEKKISPSAFLSQVWNQA